MSLQPQHGSADLNASFYSSRRTEAESEDSNVGSSSAGGGGGAMSAGKGIRKHIIQVSTYHMVILMLFNNKESWTYDVSIYSNHFFFFK